MLEVRLFGGLSAAVDGRPIELPADARARELLARLALNPGPHPRSALAGRLRPDVPEDSARKTLRNALYELRRALGPAASEALVVSNDRVGLSDTVTVDEREFRRRLGDGDLEGAAALAGGELLAGYDADWALLARAEHAVELAGMFGALAARSADAGELPAAIVWARRRLDIEPVSETAHGQLIRLLALAGDRAAALAAARAMSDRLRSELGIAPSPETRALVENLRRGALTRAPAAPVAARAPEVPPVLAATAPPAGREPVLVRLEQAWREAAAGMLRGALITGEPGIGKTTLAGELARRVHARAGAVVYGRSEEHTLIPFQPWIEALERLVDSLPADEADRWLTAHDGALARLLPSRSQGPGGGGPRERYLAFDLVRRLLEGTAARWPALLVLDDVHWADEDSLALLRHVVRSTPRVRLLVVLCARPAELAPAVAGTVAELRRSSPLVHVDLTGLDDQAVATLVERHTGIADAETARRYRTRSGGNPFFLTELLREAQETGLDPAGPPAGVRDAISRRLSRLPVATRKALEAAAVYGLTFDVETLAVVDNRTVAEALEALDAAVEAALIGATDQRGRFAFAHALVPETIVAGLPASQLAGLHLRVADVLVQRHDAGAVSAGEVVRHLRKAGPLVDAARLAQWEITAATEAAATLAHADAAAHYEAALAVPGGVARSARGEALVALGRAQDRAGRRGRARDAFAAAAELARAEGDPDLLSLAALGYGGTALVIDAANETTIGLLEEALAARPGDDHSTAARLLARLAVELYYSDPSGARELSARAMARARRAADSVALAAALNSRRVALWRPHDADERLSTASEMIRAAEAAGDREQLLQARNWRVVDLLELGRIEEAGAEIDSYAALADATALPHFRWYVPMWRATLAMLAGRWHEASELSDRALELGSEADDPNAPLFIGIQRAQSKLQQRRFAEIDRQRLVTGAAARPAAAGWLAWVALLDAETGAMEEAQRLVSDLARDGCSSLAMDVNWHAACALAQAAVLVGDRQAGASLYDLLEPHARLFPLVARAVGCLGSAEQYLGRLAGLLGRHEEAVHRLRSAVAANERAGAPAWTVVTLLHLGETLAQAGEPAAAREALEQAAARAELLGMPVVALEARRELQTLAS